MRPPARLQHCLVALALCLACPLSQNFAAEAADLEVAIGLIDNFDPDFYLETFVPTIEYLKRNLPQYRFKVLEINGRDIEGDILAKKPSFLIAAASDYASLVGSVGAQQIATRTGMSSSNARQAVSSAFVVKSSRTDLTDIRSLKGKVVSAIARNSFDGWLIGLNEIASRGYDPDKFFSRAIFADYRYPNAITYVKTDVADVAVLAGCELEKLIESGFIRRDEFRIIEPKDNPGSCMRSSDLYPGSVFFSVSGVRPQTVKNITLTLLSMPRTDEGFEWTPESNFVNVYELLKSLKLGPYQYLRDATLSEFIKAHVMELLIVIAVLFAVLVHILRVNYLVAKRTNELRYVMEERRKSEIEARRNRNRLEQLEKDSTIAQLCTIIAHETKQPLTNIIYYASGLKLLLAKLGVKNKDVDTCISSLSQQANRTAEIVDQVRNYSKHDRQVSRDTDLVPLIRRAVDSLETEGAGKVEITFNPPSSAFVYVEPFEIELVVFNLLKNAVAAAEHMANGRIEVSLCESEDSWTVSVKDNGPEISDEVFSQLGSRVNSKKKEGLGIGLSIAASILENHASTLSFAKLEPQGLKASFTLKKHRG